MGLRRRHARVHSDRLQQGVRLLPEWLYEIPPMLRCQQRAVLRLESTLGVSVGLWLGRGLPQLSGVLYGLPITQYFGIASWCRNRWRGDRCELQQCCWAGRATASIIEHPRKSHPADACVQQAVGVAPVGASEFWT